MNTKLIFPTLAGAGAVVVGVVTVVAGVVALGKKRKWDKVQQKCLIINVALRPYLTTEKYYHINLNL